MAPLPEDDEAVPEPIPFRSQRPQATATAPPQDPVIGAAPLSSQQMIHRTLPSTVGVPAAPRRYKPPAGDQVGRRKMPEIYDGHRIFGYWYVPAAILVAILVAFGVIWMAGALFGDDGGTPAQNQTTTPTTTAGGAATTPQPSASVAPSAAASVSPTSPTGPGKFKAGDAVNVTGAAPECLNVRVKAGIGNDAIVCVQDGTQLKVTGGPETASELTWWKVQTELGEGWAAEDYLTKKP